jgi:hypothetical protein
MPSSKKSAFEAGDEVNPGISTSLNKTLQPIRYEIYIQGPVSSQWFDYFDGLIIQVLEMDQSLIQATLTDKSALHGLLSRIGELNLTILSIKKVEEPSHSKGFD